MLTLNLLGYRFSTFETQERTVELWCRKESEEDDLTSSTMYELSSIELFRFYQYVNNKELYTSCGSIIDEILVNLIIENKYEHKQLPREWFYKPTLKA